MKKTILLCVTLFLTVNSYSQDFDVNPIWQFGTYGHYLGKYLMKVVDIDNDDNNELIISTKYSKDFSDDESFIYILKYSEETNSYQFYWTSQLFYFEITSIFIKDINQDQYLDVFIGLKNGTIQIIDGESLQVEHVISTNYYTINSINIADADNDGSEEIIICNNNSTTIYNLEYDIEMVIPYGGEDIEIGQIDRDDKNEIVLTSGKIIEINEGAFILEDEFNPSIFRRFELFDFDEDNRLELIYQTDYSEISCYDFESQTTSWIITTTSSIESMSIFSNSVNNTNEIYLGTSSHGINIYNALNGNFISKFPDHYEGVNNIAIGDADNDGEIEIIWSDGGNSTYADYIYIHKLEDQTLEWMNFPLNGPFTAVDYGDLDNDGDVEVLVASESSGSHDGGTINIFNPANGQLEWQSEPYSDDMISSVKIADIDNDGINEFLVGIEHTGYPLRTTYLYIYETQTYEVESTYILSGCNRIRDIEVADINNDMVNEIIVGTGSGWSSDMCYIYILSGETNNILWQSEPFGGILNFAYSLNISNIDNDPALEILGIHYDFMGNDESRIFIIDGIDYSVQFDSQHLYSCLTTGDYNNDNQMDIIVGTGNGEIIALNGLDLEPLNYMNTSSEQILAIDFIENDTSRIIYSDGIKLKTINKFDTTVLWSSVTINSSIGAYNNMIFSNINGIEYPEIIVGSNQSAYLFPYPFNDTLSNVHNEFHYKTSTYVYPNPCYENTTINIYLELKSDIKIEVYNMYGESIFSQDYNATIGQNRILLQTNSFPPGTYIYKIFQDNFTIASNKIIKM